MNAKGKSLDEANQIVTDHLVKRFIQETDFFYAIVETGNQLILFNEVKLLCIIDVSNNKDSTSLIELFCKKYAHKNNILVNVQVEEINMLETLVLTLQDGSIYYMQDCSRLYIKLEGS